MTGIADRVLFHCAPDVYDRRTQKIVRAEHAPRLRATWEEALTLPGASSLEESFLLELQDYFQLSLSEVRRRMDDGARIFSDHFQQHVPPGADTSTIEAAYEGTDLEAFELAEWHARRFEDGPVNYALALEAVQRAGGTTCLDYGSGIGSGAILFARHGLDVTLADISAPLLDFAAWRLARRGLAFRLIHLREHELGAERWDLITLFDVLEHCTDPVAVVGALRPHLHPLRGLLTIRAPFDDARPQHIPHEPRTPSRFAALGFKYAWDLMGPAGLPIALRPSQRGPIATRMVSFLLDRPAGAAGGMLRAARRLRRLGRPRPGAGIPR